MKVLSAEQRIHVRQASGLLRVSRPDLSGREARALLEPLVIEHPRASVHRLVELVGDSCPQAPTATDDARRIAVPLAAVLAVGFAVGWLILLPEQLLFAYVLAVVVCIYGGRMVDLRGALWWLASAAFPVFTFALLVREVVRIPRPAGRRRGAHDDSERV